MLPLCNKRHKCNVYVTINAINSMLSGVDLLSKKSKVGLILILVNFWIGANGWILWEKNPKWGYKFKQVLYFSELGRKMFVFFAIQKANFVDIKVADFGDMALCSQERRVV